MDTVPRPGWTTKGGDMPRHCATVLRPNAAVRHRDVVAVFCMR
jgi:hypothetical protein